MTSISRSPASSAGRRSHSHGHGSIRSFPFTGLSVSLGSLTIHRERRLRATLANKLMKGIREAGDSGHRASYSLYLYPARVKHLTPASLTLIFSPSSSAQATAVLCIQTVVAVLASDLYLY